MVKTKMERYLRYVPTKFCVVSGSAISKLSRLNAFDGALKRAGIADCNLVQVSSVIPENAKLVKLPKLPPGTILFTTFAKMEGDSGRIGAGVAWSWGNKKSGARHGIVVEAIGSDAESIKIKLNERLRGMADTRGLKLEKPIMRVECVDVPQGRFGCAFSALIFLP